MRIAIATAGMTAAILFAPSAWARGDAPLTCTDLAMPITGVADDATFSFTIPVDDLTTSP